MVSTNCVLPPFLMQINLQIVASNSLNILISHYNPYWYCDSHKSEPLYNLFTAAALIHYCQPELKNTSAVSFVNCVISSNLGQNGSNLF